MSDNFSWYLFWLNIVLGGLQPALRASIGGALSLVLLGNGDSECPDECLDSFEAWQEIIFAIEIQASGELNARACVLNCFAGLGMVSNKDDLLLRDFIVGAVHL